MTDTLPQIWATLTNTFLDELPNSVKCPRLTSNLKDESTTRTAAMPSNAKIPDDATVQSKWSRAPKITKPPTRAVIVNYTDQNFPGLEPTTKPNTESKFDDPRRPLNPLTLWMHRSTLLAPRWPLLVPTSLVRKATRFLHP